MSLFLKPDDPLRARESNTYEVDRWVLAVPVLLAADADGLSQATLERLTRVCAISPIFREHSAKSIGEMAQRLAIHERGIPFDRRCKRIASMLTPSMRETALALAIQMVLIDGHYDEEEHERLQQISAGLGVGPDDFLHMFEVLVILHRNAE